MYRQFHRVLNIFQNFDRHIGSTISNFENLTPDSDLASPKTYSPISPIFVINIRWKLIDAVFFENFQVKNYHFENDNDFYDENQKYTVKRHDFYAPMVEKSEVFSRFQYKKNHDKNFFAKFSCFFT